MDEPTAIGSSGGLVAVDAGGHVTMPFNCAGMCRGLVAADGGRHTAIYPEPFRLERA